MLGGGLQFRVWMLDLPPCSRSFLEKLKSQKTKEETREKEIAELKGPIPKQAPKLTRSVTPSPANHPMWTQLKAGGTVYQDALCFTPKFTV